MRNDLNGLVVGVHPTVSTLKTSNYTVIDSDYLVGVGTLSSDITISLPPIPSTGDQYIIKDVNGTVGDGYILTIDGNGSNIDGQSTFVLAQPYASLTVVFTGSQWSICLSHPGTANGNGYGLYSSLPHQGQAGRTYYATDTGTFLYDDGTAWQPFAHDGALTPLKSSDFTWQNQNGAMSTDFGTGIFIDCPANNGIRFFYQSVPSTPYIITAKFIYLGTFISGASMIYGLGWGDGTKLITCHINDNGTGMNSNVVEWNSPTSFNSEVYTNNFADTNDRLEWMRIADDGSTRSFSVSRDGINFIEVYGMSNSTFFTSTRVGMIISPPASASAYFSCLSWNITT